MTYATYEDVVKRWTGEVELTAPQEQIETLLDDAEDTILIEFPNLHDRVDSGELREATVIRVEARMVTRHLRNPEGVRSAQLGAGPYQQTTTYGGDEPGALYLTDDDRRELRGSIRARGKVFMVDTTPPCTRSYDGWWF
ncbi:Gp19/Gp15/Gp42 family protein [Streptomyces lasalocidi]|uniref:Uncharacterized protein n=1 Tax=Streptomyces lasalocidi TaxID=324833 RepID=A0A4U5WQ39_STRLS|nr:Gp19/Gp15/Gp42 family protein [Streptomyces lasalocidi]TKT03441.1 hypothetical protein E4U91_27340 [Streptomyces lasalocidi]